METNLDRTAVVIAAMGLISWLMVAAPDEVQNEFLSSLMVMMLFHYWTERQRQDP